MIISAKLMKNNLLTSFIQGMAVTLLNYALLTSVIVVSEFFPENLILWVRVFCCSRLWNGNSVADVQNSEEATHKERRRERFISGEAGGRVDWPRGLPVRYSCSKRISLIQSQWQLQLFVPNTLVFHPNWVRFRSLLAFTAKPELRCTGGRCETEAISRFHSSETADHFPHANDCGQSKVKANATGRPTVLCGKCWDQHSPPVCAAAEGNEGVEGLGGGFPLGEIVGISTCTVCDRDGRCKLTHTEPSLQRNFKTYASRTDD